MEDCELEKMVREIHTVIVGSIDGKLGMLERMRVLETFVEGIKNTKKLMIGWIVANISTVAAFIYWVHNTLSSGD